ncbi:MAG TPA: LytTR family DNA-binding domain-containing protein [Gemmatimonadales bacterium]|nr:LytTR family DNA-binding domain-containing protein [Gemmatimonadales bacterium]
MTLTVVIADDEELAREQLRALAGELPDTRVVGEAADGPTALQLIDELRPDLVLLGLALPGMTGIEIARRMRHRPAVVFTTAFDHAAVAAFELQAVDYLIKPFDEQRFKAAIERARERAQTPPELADGERLRHALYESGHLSRFFVRDRNRILVVPTGEVERLEARGDYVALHAGARRHLVQVTIADMERMLDPGRFVRVHRSHIVNLDYVVAFTTDPKGALEVELRSGTRLSVSRSRAQALRNLVM